MILFLLPVLPAIENDRPGQAAASKDATNRAASHHPLNWREAIILIVTIPYPVANK